MPCWIALLRGINVSGHNIIAMKDLRLLLEDAGLKKVQTYIQSGNCVFTSTKSKAHLSKLIRQVIGERFDVDVPVTVLPLAEMEKAIRDNPFAEQGQASPKSVHLYFLNSKPADADLVSLSGIAKTNESFQLKDKVLYLFAPDGIGRSKLASAIEGALGVSVTARNMRTVTKIAELARSI